MNYLFVYTLGLETVRISSWSGGASAPPMGGALSGAQFVLLTQRVIPLLLNHVSHKSTKIRAYQALANR